MDVRMVTDEMDQLDERQSKAFTVHCLELLNALLFRSSN
jgi:hypothetical protein